MRAALLAAAAACCASVARAITLDGNAIFVIPGGSAPGDIYRQSPNVSTGVGLALRDVSRDFYKVLGYVPYVAASMPAANSLPNGTVVVYFGNLESAPWLSSFDLSDCFTGWESHCVKAFAAGPNGYPSIVATGTGDRGAIYGAYSFSENVLGVNPWYLWTDDEPTYVGSLPVNDTLDLTWAPPKFAHRTWFPNDEDLLGNNNPDPLGRAVFDVQTWDDICQTLLRLKGNGILVGTNPFPDEDSVSLVARRGVVVQHHHYNLLGINVFTWPLPADDWDWKTNAGTMSYAWKASVAAQAGKEMVWSVGLRGLNDESYTCGSPSDCGTQISEVLSNQTKWIADIAGPNQKMVLYMWDELLDLLVGGYLTIPAGVDVIFADAGAGFILINSNVTKYADGVYYHTAMYNYVANQLTEMVPADRIFAQLTGFVQYANQTTYAIDNLSDLVPVPMTSEAFLRFTWDPAPFMQQDPNTTAKLFYASWAQRQLRLSAADAQTYAAIWSNYFLVPYIQSGNSDNGIAENIASLTAEAASSYQATASMSAKVQSDAVKFAANVGGQAAVDAYQSVYNAAVALLPAVPTSRQNYYTSHTITNMATVYFSAQAQILTSNAVAAVAAGNMASAVTSMQAAVAGMDTLFQLRRVGEQGKWKALYYGDHLTDMQRVQKALKQFLNILQNPKPVGAPLSKVTPYLWYEFYDYQKAPAVTPNWPFIHYNSTWNLASYVRINCVIGDVTSGTCSNNPTGGFYASASNAAVTLQIMTSQTDETAAADGLIIRYTLDGSIPTVASTPYVAGLPPQFSKIATNSVVNITAMAFVNDVATGQVTNAVYYGR